MDFSFAYVQDIKHTIFWLEKYKSQFYIYIESNFCLDSILRERIKICRKEKGKKRLTWRIFSLKELHAATNNFNYDNKLGEGGFGSVYWGQLWDGSQVLNSFTFQHMHAFSCSFLFFSIFLFWVTSPCVINSKSIEVI